MESGNLIFVMGPYAVAVQTQFLCYRNTSRPRLSVLRKLKNPDRRVCWVRAQFTRRSDSPHAGLPDLFRNRPPRHHSVPPKTAAPKINNDPIQRPAVTSHCLPPPCCNRTAMGKSKKTVVAAIVTAESSSAAAARVPKKRAPKKKALSKITKPKPSVPSHKGKGKAVATIDELSIEDPEATIEARRAAKKLELEYCFNVKFLLILEQNSRLKQNDSPNAGAASQTTCLELKNSMLLTLLMNA
jgi:hypothetical protein